MLGEGGLKSESGPLLSLMTICPILVMDNGVGDLFVRLTIIPTEEDSPTEEEAMVVWNELGS